MSANSDPPVAAETWGDRAYREWERFWFRPADPTLLGLIRIGCGLIVLYSMIACAFDLQNFVGEDGWLDLETTLQTVREGPYLRYPLKGIESPIRPPSTELEKKYLNEYMLEFKQVPPAPYPQDDEEKEYCHQFRRVFKYDLRYFGLLPPSGSETKKKEQREFLEEFAIVVSRPELFGHSEYFNQPPAPPYPTTARERQERLDYAARYGVDPRRLLYKGQPFWSLYFHVTDPREIRLLHAAVLVVALLFTVGFCTRLTAVLTWFAYLNYVHRNGAMLFGVDVMTNIVLIYLMIGPSGAALSLDRLIARWWSRNKAAAINRWRSLWGKAALRPDEIRPAHYQAEPEPSVAANVAIRLLQIHVCIIYFMSGISKLTGRAWWNGTAVWGAIANFELAPMQYQIYNILLRFVAHNELVFSTFLILGTYFTLAFEIGYPFLIWRPRFRRLFLASALLLHGMIGVVMGLKSFALIMLVMNLAFLTSGEAHLLIAWPGRLRAWCAARWARPTSAVALETAVQRKA